ncbi:MAG: F-box-like domain-containing protein, partial [Planctomycetota bacterium]|nr:F-box-like domain-containing protein [Planctomycetota bacterium]
MRTDAALRILSYLDPRAVLNTAETSPKWRKLATSDVVWRLEGATKKEEVTGVAVVGRGMDLLAKGKGWGVAKPKKVGGGSASGGGKSAAAAAEEGEDAGRWHVWYRSVTVAARLTDTEWNGTWRGERDDADYPDGSLRHAVKLYFEDKVAAKARYGRIETWDTSRITDMSRL